VPLGLCRRKRDGDTGASSLHRHPFKERTLQGRESAVKKAGFRSLRTMGTDEPLRYACKHCGALIYYMPCEEPEGTLLGLVANCPKCGAIIPELGGATMIAFEAAERAEDDERRH
jgi:hypothetical protein